MRIKNLSHPGNILLAGFGLMLLMMGVLVYASIRQDIPLVSKQYYEQELVYEQKMEAGSNAAVYSQAFQVQVSGNELVLSLPSELTQQMEDGIAWFYCPSSERMDRKLKLEASANGQYLFNRHQLPGKGYLLKLSFSTNGKQYYKEFNLPW